MTEINDKAVFDIAEEVYKQTLHDFTASYWNKYMAKKGRDEDNRVLASSLNWLLDGTIAELLFSEEERYNVVRKAVKLVKQGYFYDIRKGFIKAKKGERIRISV